MADRLRMGGLRRLITSLEFPYWNVLLVGLGSLDLV